MLLSFHDYVMVPSILKLYACRFGIDSDDVDNLPSGVHSQMK
jgi:hypothetical protein